MMNTGFKTNFELNLVALCKILRREYKLPASYNPDGYRFSFSFSCSDIKRNFVIRYAAINVKYVSPIAIENVVLESLDDTIIDTTISFFIFRTGSVIINSARSIAQQNEAYVCLQTRTF